MFKFKKFLLVAALLLAANDGLAQTNPPTPPPYAALGGQTTLSATNSSSRVALPASTVAFGAVTVYNASTTVDAYVALGDVTVVAVSSAGTCAAPTFTMCLVKAGTSIVIWASSNTYIAGITASSSASLVIYQGSGGVQLSAIYSGTSPPSGPAGGDLAGTYPNPTVAQASAGFALPSSALTFSGNITGAAIFGTSGIKVKTTSGTLSDTTSSGTVATNYNNLFGGNTLTATSATTITSNFGSYFTAPVCSTNVTCTNNYALGADSLSVANLVSAANFTATGQVTIGVGNTFTVSGRSRIASPADGTIQLTNNAQTSFGVLQLYSDTGISRDSVLGALNLDLGNGTANDKTGILNAAKVALGGCTVGTDNLCVTGTSTLSGNMVISSGAVTANSFTAGSTGTLVFGSRGIISSAGAGQIQIGNADAASPVAQTLAVQNVIAGTTNTIGQPVSLNGSQSTGTAAGGSVLIKTATADTTHTVNTFTGSSSPYTIGFTAGNITTYPIGTVMTVSGCTTGTLNGTYTVTASSSGSVTATTSATGTGSPTTCLIVGNTSQNPEATVVTIDSFGALALSGPTTNAAFSQSGAGSNVYNGSILAGGTTVSNGTVFLYRGSDNANVLTTATGGIGFSGTSSPSGNADASFWRLSTGLVEVSNATSANASGSLKFTSYVAGGSAPTPTGTCTHSTQTGGNTAGTIVLTCTAQTLILTFATTAPTGWMCEAIDQTTTADTMKQTSNSTTTCTLTGTTAASDVILFQARAY